ncbi:MAG: agmatinase [Cellvibrionaceae bacterium]|jgi:agmatinase
MKKNSYSHFLSSEIEQGKPEDAFFHVIPVPYEESVSYGGGTRLGPAAILQASEQLELWDGKSKPADLGIYTDDVIDCSGNPEQVIERIAAATKRALALNKMPVALGGEHTVTWGVIKGFLASGFVCEAGKPNFGVVQVDAHADLRHAYEDNLYSHASVMKRIVEKGVPLYQLGIRAYCEEEIQARQDYGVQFIDGEDMAMNNIHEITLPDDFPDNVFFTLDIDGMDPSVFPSTGTPVPGGLAWYQTLHLFESVAKQRNIIGFDIMEFAPIKSFHAYDFAAALLVYKMMGIVQRCSRK